jgi:hypothetical protein
LFGTILAFEKVMKTAVLVLLIGLASVNWCKGTDKTCETLLCMVNMSHDQTTQRAVVSLLGNPARVEEGRKRHKWVYENSQSELVIFWGKDDKIEKFNFSLTAPQKNKWDNNKSRQLKAGQTDVADAIKILGLPKEMEIKSGTQQMRYGYESNVLRLFFRNQKLVDYTLLGFSSQS